MKVYIVRSGEVIKHATLLKKRAHDMVTRDNDYWVTEEELHDIDPRMTDLETLRGMLDRAAIPYTEEGEQRLSALRTVGVLLTVTRGYSGFCSEFEFDENHALKDLGAYE